MLRGHRYIFLLVVLLPIQERRWLAPLFAPGSLVDGRVEEATLPRLVSIYSGFPRFPRLCRARSASPVCIILYLFRLVTSYTRPASPPSFSFFLPSSLFSLSSRLQVPRLGTRANGTVGEDFVQFPAFARMASYTRTWNRLYELQENPRWCPSLRHLLSHLSPLVLCHFELLRNLVFRLHNRKFIRNIYAYKEKMFFICNVLRIVQWHKIIQSSR